MSKIAELKRVTPWFIKIPAKIFLSHLPLKPKRWQSLGLFRAGKMDNPAEALQIFKKHLQGSGLATLDGCTVAELGPGNSALTALFAKSFGAARTWLVDAEDLATQDPTLFVRAKQVLADSQLPVPELGCASSVSETLEKLNAEYLTTGLAALARIHNASVDYIFSNAVLEHVRLAEFPALVSEMRRIVKGTGVVSHQIDFRDHLQEGLNNLRFSERLWESNFVAGSGFYTNRLAWPKMKNLFEKGGFSVALRDQQLWPNGLPTPQNRMASPFQEMRAEDLMVMSAHVILRPH